MNFFANDLTNDQIGDGTRLEVSGPAELCRVGTGYHCVVNKDRRYPMSIETMGHPMTGSTVLKHDVVADITIDGKRFGMIRDGVGQLGPVWRISGDPYNETFAPLA